MKNVEHIENMQNETMTGTFPESNQLTVKELAAYKGERYLFRQLSFELKAKELLHLTGSNGVGKTSLLRILIGLGFIEEGNVYWNKETIQTQRAEYYQSLHYLGHKLGIKEGLSCFENLYYYARQEQTNIDQEFIHDVLTQVGLAEKQDLQVQFLSAGQKQRLAIARLLLLPRALWILDEPFTALDSHAQTMLNEHIEAHLEKNGMVIVTTHQDSLNINQDINVLTLKAA